MSLLDFFKYQSGRKYSLTSGLIIFFFFISLQNICSQQFKLSTKEAGLQLPLIPGNGTNGVAVADYDVDGDLDIYLVAWDSFASNDKRTWNRLFSNNGDGTFTDATSKAGVAGDDSGSVFSYMGYKMGASWGDYDNDGFPDLFLTHTGPNQLFHNNGDGTFSEVTAEAGVAGGKTQLSSSALWFDYDLDGDLDLYVSNWEDYAFGPRDKRNWLYENTGNGKFADVSEASGADDNGKTWTTVAMDVNNDGYPDLYLANDFGDNKLYINNTNKTFSERTAEFGLEDRFEGMGLAIADCDGNGYFDIYLTNVTENGFDEQVNPLFLNTGNNFFTKNVNSGVALAGWGWGTEFFDLDNDSDEDLFVVNGYFSNLYTKRLFRNDSNNDSVYFTEVSKDLSLIDSTEARGLAVFDYNNDGHPDILISNFTMAPSLYENPLKEGNWIKIELEGTISNRNGFGSVIEVEVNGKTFKKYYHGAQFLAQNIIPLHFGLGNAQHIDKLTVKWLNGYTDEIKDVGVNQLIKIKEKSGLVSSIAQELTGSNILPGKFELLGSYPNPFNGSTLIKFILPVPGDVELNIITITGEIIEVINTSFGDAGEKTIRWDAVKGNSNSLSSGLYFYRIKVNNSISKVGKMIYLK